MVEHLLTGILICVIVLAAVAIHDILTQDWPWKP